MNGTKVVKYFCLSLLFMTTLPGCQSPLPKNEYPITPVPLKNIVLKDTFWSNLIKRVQEKTIQYALKKSEAEGRMDNFLIAGGRLQGVTKGEMPFDDTDLYKIIEGAASSLITAPNEALEKEIDRIIDIIGIGQEADGYLTTWRTIDPQKPPAPWVKVIHGKRWESLEASHELYNAGHLFEAAAAHFMATGKRNFLDIALKNADLVVNTFGEHPKKIQTVPGHQIIESGLISLFKITGKKEYLNLAKYFLDHRGKPDHHPLFGYYAQDHLPPTQQREAVGHAVRAMYMYAAMTDISVFTQDPHYSDATQKLWENTVHKKTYLTGGLGAKHQGESFGKNYELPNLTSYAETCAAIGSVYWNKLMHNRDGDVKYLDIIERTLFNGLISGLSLDGIKFFYPNALESDGKYSFNRGALTRQSWFDCSCCPTNLIRSLPTMPQLLYSTTQNTVFLNLYVSSDVQIQTEELDLKIRQQSSMPWHGKVSLHFETKLPQQATLKLRIPHWARGEALSGDLYQYTQNRDPQFSITINQKKFPHQIHEGYIVIEKKWNHGDALELHFPMPIRTVRSKAAVLENQQKVAVERGPFVYAFEEIDNKENFDHLIVDPLHSFDTIRDTILGESTVFVKQNNFIALPYFMWSNRGIGKMKVWVPEKIPLK